MSNKYAREELRAELASVFLSMELGIPVNTTQNAAYIQFWVQNLKEDKKEIFNAMNDAMKITNFIKDLAKDKIREITIAKLGKTEEPEIKVVNEPKQEIVQEVPVVETPTKEASEEKAPTAENISEPQNKAQEQLNDESLSQNSIDVTEPLEEKETPKVTNEPVAQEPIEQPEPQPSCLIITVYNPKDGEFGKELEYGKKFKLDDFARTQTEIALDASSPAEYFAKHNHGVGSLVQVDDELFYMNKDNHFKRIYAANVNGEIFIQQAANPAKFIENTIEKIGRENFDKYKTKFLEVFRTGAAVESPEMAKEDLDLAYSKFVYDNAVKFGLSSNNPIGTKQWRGANEAFMQACIKEFGANASIMDLASKMVKDMCPVKVDDDLLKQSALKSELYQQMSTQENEKVQIAAYGVR